MIERWAARWKIPSEAVQDLLFNFGVLPYTVNSELPFTSEAAVLNQVKLEASKKGARLWRNNNGATHTPEGAFIRYGLANESKEVNSVIKSADLIGIKPVRIAHDMVGRTIGQFISREIKPSNWKFKGTEREQAQLRWAQLIVSLGGDACFATCEGTI